MSRRATPENLYIAHRMAIAARLVSDARLTPEGAERSAGLGLDRGSSRAATELALRIPYRPMWITPTSQRIITTMMITPTIPMPPLR